MHIAIISSIDESCGNAAFTNHLLQSLNDYGVTANGIGLNLNYTQSVDKKIRKIADNQVKKIVESLKDFDGVNLQFEAGLYGTNGKDILKRLNLLLRSGKNTSVTIHSNRIFPTNSLTFRSLAKAFFMLRFKTIFFSVGKLQAEKRSLKLNRAVVKACVEAKVEIIVHTKKSADAIMEMFNYDRVHVHPLKFTDPGKVLPNKVPISKVLHLNSDVKTIGIFGFISKYKGIETAIEAMNYLPSNYHLVIVGRQHPQSIQEYSQIDSYIKKIIKKIKENALTSRVHFLNELSDEELLEWAASVDFGWLPYLEVGQDGSGIASILFDIAQRVIASNAKSFDELLRLIPEYQCERFDIGNYLELAGKTLNYREMRNLQTHSRFTCETQTKLYVDVLAPKL